MIMMDHTNLQYWKSPWNLTWWMARWHLDLQEYNYEIMYIPGKENGPPDALSRPLGADQGKQDNQDMMVLPLEKFKINVTEDQAKGKIRVLPLEEVKQGILNLVHNHPTAEHLGCNETLQQVQERYYWPGMKEWITEYSKDVWYANKTKYLHIRRQRQYIGYPQRTTSTCSSGL
jgi:hypothetical protein